MMKSLLYLPLLILILQPVAQAEIVFNFWGAPAEVRIRVGAATGITTVTHNVPATQVGDGTPIAGWPGTYMLNLAAPDVVEWLAQQTAPAVHEIGYDGVFIDCMGPHFDTWACEIASGKPYTVDYNADREDDDREQLKKIWKDAKTTLARRTRELLGKKRPRLNDDQRRRLAVKGKE